MTIPHLLLVDDNELNRDMLARRVRQQGYTFDMAEDGREALEKLAAASYDLVLLDIMMPEVDGYAVLQQAKADPALRHIPIIMISAIDEIENTARCIEMGADDYLTKPFNPTLLKARIQSSLEKKRLRDKEQLYAKTLENDLEVGRRIQGSFLPDSLPVIPGWELVAVFQPARQVSGDFYDAFSLVGGTHLGIVMADVCDKGVGAALFMALFRTLLRAMSESNFPAQNATSAEIAASLHRTISQTNEYIARTHGNTNMFATIFFGVQNLQTGFLHYINGGHEPPLLQRASGMSEHIEPTGPIVGALPGMEFEVQSVMLNPGDILLCYTDGVSEARNAAGKFFGEERLPGLVAASARDSLDALMRDLTTFIGDTPQNDDITLLALRRAG